MVDRRIYAKPNAPLLSICVSLITLRSHNSTSRGNRWDHQKFGSATTGAITEMPPNQTMIIQIQEITTGRMGPMSPFAMVTLNGYLRKTICEVGSGGMTRNIPRSNEMTRSHL